MTNQEKLFQLMRENDLNLSLKDLIEFTYHQWSDQYLSEELAEEHLTSAFNNPDNIDLVQGKLSEVLALGRIIYKDKIGR